MDKQHHDSGYFPGMSDKQAWVVLGAAALILAAIIVAAVFIVRALSG